MKKTRILRFLSLALIVMLIATMALTLNGCKDKGNSETGISTNSGQEAKVVGEGETVFYFNVENVDKSVHNFEVHTDKKTVGEALLEAELIEESTGTYGLFVKTVNGITYEYEKDGKYWAFYINGEYANTGVSQTEIEPGSTYTFKAE